MDSMDFGPSLHAFFDPIGASLAELRPADVAVVAGALLLIHLSRYAGMWLFAIVVLPGTALHELSHFCVALVLGARPTFPSLIPQRVGSRWQLGEVRFRHGHLRAMFVALAPLLLLPLAVWWTLVFVVPAAWPWYALHVWIAAALLHSCLPSRTDLRLAMPALLVIAAAIAAAAAVYYFGR